MATLEVHGKELFDGVETFRGTIFGVLHAMAQRNGWSAKEAASALGVSEVEGGHLVAGKASMFSLENLINMASFAGVAMRLTVEVPQTGPGNTQHSVVAIVP